MMYNNVGFFITDIKEGSHDHILSQINEYILQNPYDNVVVFNDSFNKINNGNKFYLLHINEAKYFDGILFIFNPTDASICATFPGPKKQIFYATELYWHTTPYIPYASWKTIFLDSHIDTVVSSQKDYDVYSLCWKTPILVEKTFDKEMIKNVLQKI